MASKPRPPNAPGSNGLRGGIKQYAGAGTEDRADYIYNQPAPPPRILLVLHYNMHLVVNKLNDAYDFRLHFNLLE